jgi:phosphoserine aminotransferase
VGEVSIKENQMSKIYNFCAGPAVLPTEVMTEIQQDLPNWHGTGMSMMEMSHRGKEFSEIAANLETETRELLKVPKTHHILFMQGGATGQFSAVPMNLLRGKTQADYFNTGHWSQMTMKEATIYCQVNEVANATKEKPYCIPDEKTWKINPDSAYLHYTSNETIYGVQFNTTPNVSLPLVADMSSDIFSRPIDVEKHGLIYAAAQKNMGISGVTMVIVRDDLIHEPWEKTPTILRYDIFAEKASLYHTPCTFGFYVSYLMMKWMKNRGGLEAIQQVNERKAKLLYDVIDEDDFYQNFVFPEHRSLMNVVFLLPSEELTKRFLEEAKKIGLLNLEGYRTVGGIRASIYNAMPEEGVTRLAQFMRDFRRTSI